MWATLAKPGWTGHTAKLVFWHKMKVYKILFLMPFCLMSIGSHDVVIMSIYVTVWKINLWETSKTKKVNKTALNTITEYMVFILVI